MKTLQNFITTQGEMYRLIEVSPNFWIIKRSKIIIHSSHDLQEIENKFKNIEQILRGGENK